MAARDDGNAFHAQQLARYCRICANLLRKKGSKTTVYKCKAKLDLLKQLGIDTDHDNNTIHPEHICNSCNTKLSPTTFPAHHLERRDKQSAQCAARRRAVVGRLPPTCVDSASCQCALFLALNCTTPKWTHNATCENSLHPSTLYTFCL